MLDADPMVIQNGTGNTFIMRINEVIASNMKDERFGVSELAGKMNMSRTTLHRKIKSATDHSVSQFLRNARLNKALELLCRDYMTVAETAYLTGFRSATYFSKCFREHYGYPPVEAKKRILDASDFEDSKQDEVDEKTRNLMHNFPLQTTSFIGREKEIEAITSFIDKHRIVTLTGTGGCGKTRLACEAARQLVMNYPDGIWFVDLAPVETVDLVAKQLMTTLGFTEIPGGDMMKIVMESIRNKRLLILLDNCEHLLITCAEIARRLIESVPGISLIVTSREVLNIQGEKIWRVPSLTLADHTTKICLGEAESSEAVRLFTDRARLKNSDFKLDEENVSAVTTLCYKVDGLPLAIELIASRARHMDTMTILDRLSERFDKILSLDQGITHRHRSIQTAIEWSYNLLTADEKALFRRLSVFAGGFDLEAVEEVCSNKSLCKENILDLLCRLVDTCMIQATYSTTGHMRYRMLEILKQYAGRLVMENNEADEISERHLEYYTRMAEEAFQERLKSQQAWIDKLDQEHDNLISALKWSDINSPDTFVRLSGALGWFWRFHSHLTMGCDFLERGLAKNTARTEYYARALYGLGLLLSVTKDVAKAIDLLNESLNLWRQYKNVEQEATVLRDLIFPYQSVGDEESSQACGNKCLELAKQTKNLELINHCLGYVCFNFITAKNFNQAKPMITELLDTSEKLNQPDGIVIARHYMGDCALADEDFKEAERRYAISIETARRYGNILQSVNDVLGVAFAVSGQSRWAKSIRLDAAATEKARLFGVSLKGLARFWDEWIDTYIEGAKKVVGEELAKQYEEEGIAMGFEKAVKYALDFKKD